MGRVVVDSRGRGDRPVPRLVADGQSIQAECRQLTTIYRRRDNDNDDQTTTDYLANRTHARRMRSFRTELDARGSSARPAA